MKSALFFPLDAVLANTVPDLDRCPLLTDVLVRRLEDYGCKVENTHIEVLFASRVLDVRTHNVLVRDGVRWLADLVAMTPHALLDLRNFGMVAYTNVIESLGRYLAPWWDELVAVDAAEPAFPLTPLADSDLLALLDLSEMEWRDLPASQRLCDVCELVGIAVRTLGDVVGASETSSGGVLASLPHHTVRAAIRDMTHLATEELAGLLVSEVAGRSDGPADIPGEEPITVSSLLDALAARFREGTPARASSRALEVLFARWGIYDGQNKTLNELGEQLGLTRERVRQLIARAEERLEKPDLLPLIRGLGLPVAQALAALGGVARVGDVAAGVSRLLPFGAVDPVRGTHLLASWSEALRPITRDRLALNQYSDSLIERAKAAIATTVETYPDGLAFDDFVARAQMAGGDDLGNAGRPFIAAMVRCADRVAIVDGECRPAGRGSLRARLMAALRAIGHPAHFTELAAAYRRMFPQEDSRTDNSVHALMDRFREDVVLVGHGTFALAEWGYDPALRDVASVVEDALRQAEGPLHRDEVVRRVVEHYRWKPVSVAAALSTDKHIRACGNAFFTLRERLDSAFDPETAPSAPLGKRKRVRVATIVAGISTNERGNAVIRLCLTQPILLGRLPLSSKYVRACFPDVGDMSALCCEPSGEATAVTLHRGNTTVTGLGAWLAATGARAGDELLVERLDDALPGEARYLLVYAPPDQTAAALRLVGLRPDALSGGAPTTTEPLFSLSNLDAVRQLIAHALAHPWAEISDAQAALGFAQLGTQGSAYQRLGVRSGLLADGQVAGHGAGLIFRPTRTGRAWVSGAGESDPVALQRALALRLPAYRHHLRGIAPGEAVTATLSPLVVARWDRLFDLTPCSAQARAALDVSSAFVLARDLRRPALALLLLLLAAQSHGLGVSLTALSLGTTGGGVEAADHLRSLGLAFVVDAAGRAALGERVTLGVDNAHALEARLRDFASPVGTALADAWCAVQPVCARAGCVDTQELFAALQSRAPLLLSDALTNAPAALSDTARAATGTLFDCSLPPLIADLGWAREQPAKPFAFWRDVIACLGARVDDPRTPAGICLCDDLMRRAWDGPRHLDANAHLALLVALACDDDLAARIHHGDGGWELDGWPLVAALDRMLGALGYDVWDEGYRRDPDHCTALGEGLVALGERLGLLCAEGLSLEAVGPLASSMYYGVYYANRDPLARVRDALAATVL